METKRQLDVLDRHLADNEFMAGEEYTIADMAIWPWYGGLVLGRLYNAAEFLDVQSYKNVNRWADAIDARPAVKRGRMVNKTWGEPSEQLRERHDASDFELKTQDKLDAAVSELVDPRGAEIIQYGVDGRHNDQHQHGGCQQAERQTGDQRNQHLRLQRRLGQ
jgi:hypothetical protein